MMIYELLRKACNSVFYVLGVIYERGAIAQDVHDSVLYELYELRDRAMRSPLHKRVHIDHCGPQLHKTCIWHVL